MRADAYPGSTPRTHGTAPPPGSPARLPGRHAEGQKAFPARLGLLGVALGHLIFKAPFRHVLAGPRAIVQLDAVAVTGVPSPAFAIGNPAQIQAGCPVLAVGLPACYLVELENVEMGVPSVVPVAPAPVGDLQRPDLSDPSHLSENRDHCAIFQETHKGLALLCKEHREVVTSLVGGGQRQEGNRAPLGLVHLHCVQQLDAPALRDLGCADRARPDAAACLQTPIAGRVVGLGLPDLNVCAPGADTHAFRCPARWQDGTGNRLQGELLNP